MAEISRKANVTWEGSLTEGSGTLGSGSGVLRDVPVSWQARTGTPGPATSPEELIAAAHASCYAMALSNVLTRAGHEPERLDISAEVVASLTAEGLRVGRSKLHVRGRVPGVDQPQFAELARQGEQACPVSGALRGNLDITVEAELEPGAW